MILIQDAALHKTGKKFIFHYLFEMRLCTKQSLKKYVNRIRGTERNIV